MDAGTGLDRAARLVGLGACDAPRHQGGGPPPAGAPAGSDAIRHAARTGQRDRWTTELDHAAGLVARLRNPRAPGTLSPEISAVGPPHQAHGWRVGRLSHSSPPARA